MEKLVIINTFDKLFYVTAGTEVAIYGDMVRFFPPHGEFVFVDGVKFFGVSSFDNKEREMTGAIKQTCRNIETGDVMECNNMISLKDGHFSISGLDADSNRITLTLEPIADKDFM